MLLQTVAMESSGFVKTLGQEGSRFAIKWPSHYIQDLRKTFAGTYGRRN